MTMAADPAVFSKPTPNLTTRPADTLTQKTRKNADGSTDVLDVNGNIVSHTPAPAPTTFGAGPATPPSFPDIDPTTGQPRASGSQQLPNGTTGKVIQNSDGSRVIVDANGNIIQRIPAPATGQAPAPSPTPTGAGAGGTNGKLNGGGQIQAISNGFSGVGGGIGGAQLSFKYRTTDGQTFDSQADAQAHQDQVNGVQAPAPNVFGLNGVGVVSDSTDPVTQAREINENALVNRTQDQTVGDIARVSEAGAVGQQGITAAGNSAAATGGAINATAQAQRLEALARGDAGLTTALNQGAAATGAAGAMATPLAGLGNLDQSNGMDARAAANVQVGNTASSLSSAAAQVQRLTELAATGDPTAVAQLQQFRASGGTAAALTAAPTVASATGALGGFTGNTGTAPSLTSMPTTLDSTGKAAGFTGSTGQSGALAALDTNSRFTPKLSEFTGTSGTAPELAGFDTRTEASDALGDFSAGGNKDLATLERAAGGADIGPSAAEALQRKNADQGFAQNIALANSGRGAGANASSLRQALFTNAAGSQQLGVDVAKTRADEAATARGQNITAATAAAGTATTQSGQTLAALQTKQTAETTALQTKLSALVASGQMSQAQAQAQLDALKTAQAADTAAIGQKSANLVSSGSQLQTASQQQLDALKVQQAGEIASTTARFNALVAAGTMTQAQAAEQLDALKSKQQGELASFAQQGTNLANAGAQEQTASQQQLAALQAAATGQTASQATRVQAATAAGSTANTSAATSADLAKTFANLGLSYDVNSGNVFNNAGQIVMTGQQVAATLTSAGLGNQAQQGANASSITQQGTQALTTLTNTSVQAQQAAALLGFQTAGAITSLSQAELSQLDDIVQRHDANALQQFAINKNVAVQIAGQDSQKTAAIFSAFGTLIAGTAGLIAKGAQAAGTAATS